MATGASERQGAACERLTLPFANGSRCLREARASLREAGVRVREANAVICEWQALPPRGKGQPPRGKGEGARGRGEVREAGVRVREAGRCLRGGPGPHEKWMFAARIASECHQNMTVACKITHGKCGGGRLARHV